MFGSGRRPSQQGEQRQRQQQQQDHQKVPQKQYQQQQHDHLQHAGDQTSKSAPPATASDAPEALQMLESEYFDLNVLKG